MEPLTSNMKARVLKLALELQVIVKDDENLNELIDRLEKPSGQVIFEIEHLTLACHLINAENRKLSEVKND